MRRVSKGAARLPKERVFVDEDPSVDILLEKYKLLRAEAGQNSAKNNRQVTYIQIYGVFLVAVAGAYYQFSPNFSLDAIPDALTIPLLVIAASLLFYLYSQIYLSSFSFRVLRLRMAEIERELNRHAGSQLLKYERQIAPELFGRATIGARYLSPNAWLQFFLLILFLSAAYVVSVLGLGLLRDSPTWALLFIGSIVFFCFALVWENFRISQLTAINFDDLGAEKVSLTAVLFRLGRYLIDYGIVVTLVFIFFFDRIDNPVSSYTISVLSGFFDAIANFSHRTIIISISFYTALCAIVLPTPSELPLKLTGVLDVPTLFVAAAFGKGVGAAILLGGCQWYFRFSKYDPSTWARILNGRSTKWFSSSSWTAFAYIVCQSVPFLPMRSATVAYAAISPTSFKSYAIVVLGSGLGTIIRMGIVWAIIVFGFWAMPRVGDLP